MRTLLILLLLPAVSALGVVIPTDRVITWSNNVGVLPNGIPTVSTVYTSFTSSATSANIQLGLNQCPSNQVVSLGAGTYNLGTSLTIDQHNGVVLRGAGMGVTTLAFSGNGGYSPIYMTGSNVRDFNGSGADSTRLARWSAGYSQGTSTITLDNTNNLKLGHVIVLDQNNYGNEITVSGQQSATYLSRTNGTRGLQQYVKVTSLSGTSPNFSVGITPSIACTNFAYTTGLAPEAYWWGDSLEMVGVENLTMDYVNDGAQYGIAFINYKNCWVKGCSFLTAHEASIRTFSGSNLEVRESYFYKTKAAGSQSYGINYYYAGNGLFTDNIFNEVVGSVVYEAGSCSVFSYNYTTNVLYLSAADWMISGLATHGMHSYMNLFEGNHANGVGFDDIHGSGGMNTVVRNRLVGWEPGKTINTTASFVQQFNHNENYVGNILGKSGVHTRYERSGGSAGGASDFIWELGYLDSNHTYPANYDGVVTNTILRHGNWDVVNNAVVWDAGIADHTLPSSYYITTAPTNFGILTWPPYSADGTISATTIDPTNIPAGYRFINGTNPPAASGGGGGGSPGATPARAKRGGRGGAVLR